MKQARIWSSLTRWIVGFWIIFLIVSYFFFQNWFDCYGNHSFCIHCFLFLVLPHIIFFLIVLFCMYMIRFYKKKNELQLPSELATRFQKLLVDIEVETKDIEKKINQLTRISNELEELRQKKITLKKDLDDIVGSINFTDKP